MDNNQSSEIGSIAGGIAGSYFGPAGTGIGMSAGGMIGGLFGKKPSAYDASFFEGRASQINDYETKLNAARGAYLNSLGNMYNDAFSRFSANMAPTLANAGLTVDSGAFASELARKSSEYSAQLAPTAYLAQREDLNNVNSARATLFDTMSRAKTGSDMAVYNAGRENAQALGGFGVNLISAGLSSKNPWSWGAPKASPSMLWGGDKAPVTPGSGQPFDKLSINWRGQ